MSANPMKKGEWKHVPKNRLLQLTLVVLSLTVGMQAQDTQHCSNATLHGSYGFHATGIGFVAIGRFVFDGDGSLTEKLFIRVPGTNIGPVEFPGTYLVSSDCTVTDTWGPPLNSTHVSAIVDHGNGYFIMNVSHILRRRIPLTMERPEGS
jgi:hypothetical protein